MTILEYQRLGSTRAGIGTAFLVAAPALLVPVCVVTAVVWASYTYFNATNPANLPTISRAISEPTIATPFAMTISVAAILLGYVCFQIIRLLADAITDNFQADQVGMNRARIVLGCAGLSEALSIVGILCLIWHSEHNLHIGGSFLFFSGQSSAILFSGIVCGLLVQAQGQSAIPLFSPVGLSVRLSKLRSRVAPCIAATTMLFGVTYAVRDAMDVAPAWLHRSFSGLELFLIASFLAYLGTFSGELFRWQRTTTRPAKRP